MKQNPTILLTGATGYIGGRLLRVLQNHGFSIRCIARRPEALQHRANETTEIVYGDALKRETLTDVFKDIEVASYFVHSLG